MSEKIISDAGAGRALFLTRMKLTIHAVSMSLWAGAIPGLIIPIVLWMSCLSPRDVDIVKLDIVSHLVKQDAPRKWRIRDEAGQDQILTVIKSDGDAVQLLTAAQYRTVTASLSRPVTVFGYVMLASMLCGLLGYLSVWWSLSRLGKRARENKRVDGVEELVEPKELSRLVKKEEAGPYTVLDVALPKSAPMQGIQFMGAQGTGKSLAIHDLMQQVFQRKRKCIIYDQSGDDAAGIPAQAQVHHLRPERRVLQSLLSSWKGLFFQSVDAGLGALVYLQGTAKHLRLEHLGARFPAAEGGSGPRGECVL